MFSARTLKSVQTERTTVRRVSLAVGLLLTMAASAGAACQCLRDRERVAVDRYAARHGYYVARCRRLPLGLGCTLISFSTGSDQGHFIVETCHATVRVIVISRRIELIPGGSNSCVIT